MEAFDVVVLRPLTVPLVVSVPSRVRSVAAILFASALALAVQGYQFGKGNHSVYLLDAIRHANPRLLSHDWFTTQTLQYHAAFGVITRWLFELRLLEPACLVGYVALVVLMNIAWWRIVRRLGGDLSEMVVAVVLFYLSAAGTGLGMYQFFQDSSFLPSNIAAVALLWAICLWLEGKTVLAGACVGLAGLFHLNFAPVGLFLWALLYACNLRADRRPWRERAFWVGWAFALLPCAINIANALGVMASRGHRMPLPEFVDLYVRLRHPHHYDPSSWPAWLWISFLWPIPLAVMAYRRRRDSLAWQQSARIFWIFCLLVVIALIGAGVTYISESLVQASLYRFSIYPKLLCCTAAAFVLSRRPRSAGIGAFAVGAMFMIACYVRGPYLGVFPLPSEDRAFAAACDWVRGNTSADAVFVIPPNQQDFRLLAQRTIVVDFKGVPQLSGELPEWRDRLEAVLDMPDIRGLPHNFPAALRAMRNRYRAIPPERLLAAARKYDARYLLTESKWPAEYDSLRIDLDGNTSWFLYDLARKEERGGSQ